MPTKFDCGLSGNITEEIETVDIHAKEIPMNEYRVNNKNFPPNITSKCTNIFSASVPEVPEMKSMYSISDKQYDDKY